MWSTAGHQQHYPSNIHRKRPWKSKRPSIFNSLVLTSFTILDRENHHPKGSIWKLSAVHGPMELETNQDFPPWKMVQLPVCFQAALCFLMLADMTSRQFYSSLQSEQSSFQPSRWDQLNRWTESRELFFQRPLLDEAEINDVNGQRILEKNEKGGCFFYDP